jgi:hypothetical protein
LRSSYALAVFLLLEGEDVKTRILAALTTLIAASAIAAPAFANADPPVTRAQVRAELFQLRQAGYRGIDKSTYPEGIQAAERKVEDAGSSAGGAHVGP